MSETSGTEGKKKSKEGKPARSGTPAWAASADGARLSRTMAYGSRDEAGKAARRALATFQKAGKPVDVRLDGSNVTVSLAATDGKLDADLKKLTNRVAPRDPAKVAAKAAAKQAKAGGEA